jgi:type IV secretory pathway VirB10-like protein
MEDAMSMSTPITMAKRFPAALAALSLAAALYAGPALAQQPAPGRPDAPAASAPPNVDEAQCVREAERFGQTLLDRAASAARRSETLKQIEAASAKVKGILRDACAAAGALATEEALAATEKMAAAMLEAVRGMRSALDDFYRSLPDDQKRRLEALPKELNDWFRSFGRRDNSPSGDTSGRPLGRICIADSCFDIPGNFDFGRSDRWRDRDDFGRRR